MKGDYDLGQREYPDEGLPDERGPYLERAESAGERAKSQGDAAMPLCFGLPRAVRSRSISGPVPWSRLWPGSLDPSGR